LRVVGREFRTRSSRAKQKHREIKYIPLEIILGCPLAYYESEKIVLSKTQPLHTPPIPVALTGSILN
jgi:hypothetical protein